jgi:solute carrier family 27 (fatty acid transporter), member 1/4
VANALVANGYRRGDVVAVMMENSLEYVPVWLGMAKVGVVSALINTNQRQKALLHSLEIAKCRAFIYGAVFKDGRPQL